MKIRSLFVLMTMLFLSNSYWLGAAQDPFLRIRNDFLRMFDAFDDCRKQITDSFSGFRDHFSSFNLSFDGNDSDAEFVDGKVKIKLPFISGSFKKVGHVCQETKINESPDFQSQGEVVQLCKISEWADNFRKNIEISGCLLELDKRILNLNISLTFEVKSSKKDRATAYSNQSFDSHRAFSLRIPEGFLPKIKGVKQFDSWIELEFEKDPMISSLLGGQDSTEKTESAILSITKDTFKECVLDCQNMAIVYCYAGWSKDCAQFGSIFESQARDALKQFSLFKLDMKDIGDLADLYKIDSIPTILIFSGGKLVGKISQEKLLKTDFLELCNQIKAVYAA